MELAAKTFSDHAAIVELVNSSARKSAAYTQETSLTLEARQSDFKREEGLLDAKNSFHIARIEHKTKKRCFKEFSIDPDF